MRVRIFISVMLLLSGFIFFPGLLTADIYMFIDHNGVVHFTNAPTSSQYKLFIREAPRRTKRSVNPDAFDHIIRRAEALYEVDFSLIKAVIEVESGFNPDAVSRKGAKGLMQIMPGNFGFLAIQDPFNPTQNIMGGAKYLQSLIQRYENNLPLVLAAYNAGPGAVDQYREIPPFEETQNYVKKVMQLYDQKKNS